MIITSEKELRVKCENVKLEEVDELRAKLEEELLASANRGMPGIGLACPQIGIAKRMAIVRVSESLAVDLVNAKRLSSYDKQLFDGEGCLSFPGVYKKTMRPQEIHVINDVEPKSFIAKGLFAVAIAHDLDHLEGKLLPDFALKSVEKKKVRPNDPCFCGSNKKYKKCCGISIK